MLQKERAPGTSDSDRTVGSREEQHRRLKTVEDVNRPGRDEEETQDGGKDEQGAEFEHVKDSHSHWDAQTVDTATQEQAKVGGHRWTSHGRGLYVQYACRRVV